MNHGMLMGSGKQVETPTTNRLIFDGSDLWKVPAGVFRVLVTMWGAGGGGGTSNPNGPSAGGGGGGFTRKWVDVCPGELIEVIVPVKPHPAANGTAARFGNYAYADGGFAGCGTNTYGTGGVGETENGANGGPMVNSGGTLGGYGGAAGGTAFGGGAATANTPDPNFTPGYNGNFPGGGGSGGNDSYIDGGFGSAGRVIVEW